MKKLLQQFGIALGLAGCSAGSTPARPPLDATARAAIEDTVRAVSEAMIVAMRTRDVDSVLAYYGANTAYVGNGEIGDWPAILRGAPPRYATYTRVECHWPDPFRVDVLSRTAAVVTAVLDCEKADTSGRVWREVVARSEVLVHEDGRWKIVAVHESMKPGSGELR